MVVVVVTEEGGIVVVVVALLLRPAVLVTVTVVAVLGDVAYSANPIAAIIMRIMTVPENTALETP